MTLDDTASPERAAHTSLSPQTPQSAEAAQPARPPFEATDLVVSGLYIGSPDEPLQLYGDATVVTWNVNALGRPPARSRKWGVINFRSLRGEWLDSAKALAIALLNPDLPRLVGRAVPMRQDPAVPPSVENHMRALHDYWLIAKWGGFPASLRDWGTTEFTEALARLDALGPISEHRLRHLERVPRLLFALRDVIPNSPQSDPWPTKDQSPFDKRFRKRGSLATEPVDPFAYFSLLDAAMSYVDLFSVDILQGLRNLEDASARRSQIKGSEVAGFTDAYLTDPDTSVPVHVAVEAGATNEEVEAAINWSLLGRLIAGRKNGLFEGSRAVNIVRRAQAVAKVRAGNSIVGGIVVPSAQLDGRESPWTEGLSPIQLQNEERFLRTACYIVIAAFTMMRDSEVQSLQRGCLTTYMGLPAVRSTLLKGEPSRPMAHWWITAPVARAITVLEQISHHPEHLFASSRATKGTDAGGIYIHHRLPEFRDQINLTASTTGLTPIPDEPITPHMLRRTMALITEYERGGQLAAAHQLKHAYLVSRSNSLTGAYTAPTEKWAEELHQREGEREARRAIDELALSPTARPVGPGASRLRTVGQGAVLDDPARTRLLAQSFPDLKFGTANVCLGDVSVAACLPSDQRDGSQRVRPYACDPTQCANSVVMPTQQRLWQEEERTLEEMRKTPRMSAHARNLVSHRLAEVKRITRSIS